MGNVLRGRVGEVRDENATYSEGGVLRGRTGRSREVARQLRDALEDDTPDEAIDQADEQLEAQGLDEPSRIQKYTEQAKKQAVGEYAVQAKQGNPGAATKTERVFALIGDIANGLRGGSNTGLTQGLRDREAEATAEANQQAEQDSNLEAQAEQIREIFRRSGTEIPPGNAKAVVSVYGPAVGGLLKPQEAPKAQGEDLETYEAKRRIDAQYRAPRAEPRGFDEESYRARKKIDVEYAPQMGGGRFDPNRPLSPSEQLAKDKREGELSSPYGPGRDAASAKALRTAYEQSNNLRRSLETMKRIRLDVGPEVFEREDVGEGVQAAAEAKLALKELAKLGVLSSTDFQFLAQLLPSDPTEIDYRNLIGNFTSAGDPVLKKIEKALESAGAREEVGRKTYLDPAAGGASPGEAQAPPAAATAESSGGSAVFRVPGKGKITLDPGEVQAFLAKYPNAEQVQ